MVRRIIALLTDEKGLSRYDPVDVINNLEVLLLAAKAELEAISRRRTMDRLAAELRLKANRETSNDNI
jgi:hypothetical protein